MPRRRRLPRFLRDEHATVSVEFVILFPAFVLTLLAAFVFFDIFKSEARASKGIYTVADIISRQEEVDDALLQDLYVLFDKLVPRASDNKWMRVTSVVYDGSDYVVDWSWVGNPATGDNTATPHTDATLPMGLMPQIAANDSIILLETSIPYTPITDIVGIPPLEWKPNSVIRPRFIASIKKTG